MFEFQDVSESPTFEFYINMVGLGGGYFRNINPGQIVSVESEL